MVRVRVRYQRSLMRSHAAIAMMERDLAALELRLG